MDVSSPFFARRLCGAVDVLALPDLGYSCGDPGVLALMRLYRWLPPYQISVSLPKWYDLVLLCLVAPDGSRTFSLVDRLTIDGLGLRRGAGYCTETSALAMTASIGGHLILEDRGQLPASPLTCDEARLYAQFVKHRRGCFGKTIQLEKVLGVWSGGRVERGMRSILPGDLGLDAKGNGTPWGPIELRNEGMQAARELGIQHPSRAQMLCLGFIQAARLNPLYCTEQEAETIVRMALFACDESDEKVSEEELVYVAARVKESLFKCIHAPEDKLKSWIIDPKANLSHLISKSRHCGMKRRHVNNALIELGWRAFRIWGECVSAQMRAFGDALPEPLSNSENESYRLRFLAHPIFGGLPLPLLHDRLSFLWKALLNVWNIPNDREQIAIMHRVMMYYSECVGCRRAVDRLQKRKQNSPHTARGVPREESLPPQLGAQHSNQRGEEFAEVVKRFAAARGITQNDHVEYEARIVHQDDTHVIVNLYSESTGFNKELNVSITEFSRIAREIRNEQK